MQPELRDCLLWPTPEYKYRWTFFSNTVLLCKDDICILRGHDQAHVFQSFCLVLFSVLAVQRGDVPEQPMQLNLQNASIVQLPITRDCQHGFSSQNGKKVSKKTIFSNLAGTALPATGLA